MQPHEKVAILNPVASRPFSSLRSFPKVLQDFNATCSPIMTVSEETDLIRPKATRLASLLGDLRNHSKSHTGFALERSSMNFDNDDCLLSGAF